MRSAIGELELDEILHNRAGLNTLIKGSLEEAAVAWGLEIRRYELTEITPDDQIRIAMDKQAAAERARREQVLRTEGDKRAAELTSEGFKISMKNESEGKLVQVTNEADAEKIRILRVAEGNVEFYVSDCLCNVRCLLLHLLFVVFWLMAGALLLEPSSLLSSNKYVNIRIQELYSLRRMPTWWLV